MTQDFDAQQLSHMTDVAWNWVQTFVPRLIAALVILAVGYLLAGTLDRAVRRLLANVQMDPTLKPILAALVRYAVFVVLVVAALSQLGIQIASLLAVLGAAGLAIGLALQGTLSNIAAGIMLLWLRPFRVGDYVEVGLPVGIQGGTVEELGLFGCQLRTFDGLFLFLPNSSVWNAALRNHTRNGARMINIDISVPGAADFDRARQALLRMTQMIPHVLPAPAPRIFVQNFTGGTLVLGLTIWTAAQRAGDVQRMIIEEAKRALDALGDDFKPSQITRTVPPDTDPSRLVESPEVPG